MHSISLITKIYFLLILGLLVVFSINSIAHSGRKAFWRDETHGIEALARLHPLRSVIYGVKSQGSAAPLEYLISSVTYRLRFSLNYLFLQPHQYLRIHNVVVIWGVILITAYWINKYESFTVQTAFVIGTAFFLFNSTTYYYSSELRPFNLWGSISFLLLFALRFRDKVPRLWIVALFGLAFTITASTIQLLGLAIALVLFSQRSLKEILPLLASGGVALYYFLQSDKYSYPPPPWSQFFSFWQEFIPALILGVVLGVYYYRRKESVDLVAVVTSAGWIFLGPLSFYLIRKGGIFFDPRHYIYYAAAQAFLLFSALSVIFSNRFRPRYIIAVLIPFIIVLWRVTDLSLPGQAVRFLIYGQPVSLPVNYPLISAAIPHSLPASYEFLEIDQYHLDNKASRANTSLWWEYMQDTYPPVIYPRDREKKLVIRARDYSFELVDIKSLK